MAAHNDRMTEKASTKTKDLDTYEVKNIIGLMNREDKTVAESVEQALPRIQTAIEKIIDVMEKGGRLFYIGAGSSGRMGILDASECPPTFGVDPELVIGMIAGGDEAIRWSIEDAEDDREAGKNDVIQEVKAGDAVVGIAASGTTPYVLGGIEAAHEMGAVTVGISCNEGTPLSDAVQVGIEIKTGPEVLAGSTRLKAGTAQKMVLNMISTTTMIKLGKAYGNLMVNMQATNQKLRNRAVDIVCSATDVNHEKAQDMIDKANGDTRAAILMIMYDINVETALTALEHVNGHFRNAMYRIEKDGR